MVVVLIGYRAGQRQGGRIGATVAGGFCAIWFDLIYFAPAVMTEVLAAHCAIAALYLGDGVRSTRRTFWIGALFGLAVCLRYQYAPPLMLAAIWQYRRDAGCWAMAVSRFHLGAAAVLGGADAITWGAAFQSIWLNFARNSLDGIASLISREGAAW